MIKKETPNPHYLVLDTNILRAKADDQLVSTKLAAFLVKYAADFQITPLIPDVVRDELLYQECKKAISELNVASSSFQRINTITRKKYSFRLTDSMVKTSLANDFKKWIECYKGKVLVTPTDAIDFKDVINRSVWRLPPFDRDPKKGEKGFRDAVILETLRHHLISCPHNDPVAFICHDTLLRETAIKELSSYSNLFVYESLDDFESYLKLTKQHLEDKFIRSIVRRASQKFFITGNETTLYYKETIREKIQAKYRERFDNPVLSDSTEALVDSIFESKERQWNQIDAGMFWIYASQFVESPSDKEYIWSTRVIFTRQYMRKPSPTGGISEFIPDQRLLKLFFDIQWKARITDAARFMKMELVDISMKDSSFKTPTTEDVSEFRLNNNLG